MQCHVIVREGKNEICNFRKHYVTSYLVTTSKCIIFKSILNCVQSDAS